ncbi:MAG: hypothetical protein E5Y31_23205 [Mesorhizobium sp.]|nr:MAG: hypothetical protein E5Y31_23205 [Mesorhizobium sp.]
MKPGDGKQDAAFFHCGLLVPVYATVYRFRETLNRSLLFGAIPKGKHYALFPGKPFHTFPGIALVTR